MKTIEKPKQYSSKKFTMKPRHSIPGNCNLCLQLALLTNTCLGTYILCNIDKSLINIQPSRKTLKISQLHFSCLGEKINNKLLIVKNLFINLR